MDSEESCLMYKGKSFHNVGVATEKALSLLSFHLDPNT